MSKTIPEFDARLARARAVLIEPWECTVCRQIACDLTLVTAAIKPWGRMTDTDEGPAHEGRDPLLKGVIVLVVVLSVGGALALLSVGWLRSAWSLTIWATICGFGMLIGIDPDDFWAHPLKFLDAHRTAVIGASAAVIGFSLSVRIPEPASKMKGAVIMALMLGGVGLVWIDYWGSGNEHQGNS